VCSGENQKQSLVLREVRGAPGSVCLYVCVCSRRSPSVGRVCCRGRTPASQIPCFSMLTEPELPQEFNRYVHAQDTHFSKPCREEESRGQAEESVCVSLRNRLY